jgi:ammonium transporter, Amt family
LFGGTALFGPQIVSILATWVYAGVLTWIILKVLDATMGLRVTTEDEQMGLDLSQHNEAGYTM